MVACLVDLMDTSTATRTADLKDASNAAQVVVQTVALSVDSMEASPVVLKADLKGSLMAP